MVVRQRYAEDALAETVGRGVEQYVILGAGLDSFAYRGPDLAAVLRVFKVDHPATQQWKRARLRDLHVTFPSNLTFIPLDFEQHTLADGLHDGGYRPDLPTFFSWLGVTHCLTEEAVFKTLRYAASLAAGTEIVVQYFVPVELCNEDDRQRNAVAGKEKCTGGAGGASVEPVRSEYFGNRRPGARIHAGVGPRTRGS
jgi:methyltransferase (TIGR00027 family)